MKVPEKLTLWPSRPPAPTWAVVGQLLGALVVMGLGAHFFIEGVEHGSEALAIPAGLVALILAPLATELPEKFNSVIWLRDNKDTLAMGNITGAMVFQSTIPVSLGILFTPWQLGFLDVFSVVLALISGSYIYFTLRNLRPIKASYLMGGRVLYAIFVVVALFTILGS